MYVPMYRGKTSLYTPSSQSNSMCISRECFFHLSFLPKKKIIHMAKIVYWIFEKKEENKKKNRYKKKKE